MATTWNEDGSSTVTTNTNRGHVAMEVPTYRVTDADKKYNTEAWKRWEKGIQITTINLEKVKHNEK